MRVVVKMLWKIGVSTTNKKKKPNVEAFFSKFQWISMSNFFFLFFRGFLFLFKIQQISSKFSQESQYGFIRKRKI